ELAVKPPPTLAAEVGNVRAATFRPQSVALAGGEALVMLCLPEIAVDALKVEATNQGKDWEAFLQEHLAWCITERGGAF
ncbi:MAG: hypothetical protein L0Z53_09230, partial [Acidobacteriales bacterium]|nr:hypothetical protein [Terriglobales bacterium]